MFRYRSYFSKNNTLISGNETNSSQNPVTEISYGTQDRQVSRFLFDIDLDGLKKRITEGYMNPARIVSHKLHLTNTIRYAEQYVGKKSYLSSIDRASSFELEVFNVGEDWDEGSGYDFIYSNTIGLDVKPQASNWYSSKTTTLWSNPGAYISGVSEIIGRQRFEKGSEDLEIDITDYLNQRLFGSDYSSDSVFTGSSYGLGLKFLDEYEILNPVRRQAVAFHAKNTNTWYEPYVETVVDDTILDDRNYFYLNKENDIYYYTNIDSRYEDFLISHVNVYDHENNLVATFSGDSIVKVKRGAYKIRFSVDSLTYPDGVLFVDEWHVLANGREHVHLNQFYLISQDVYYDSNPFDVIEFENYFFYFWGIKDGETISAGDVRKVRLTVREFYADQNNYKPLELEYRLYTTVGKGYEIDVIPYTTVNRTNLGYEFDIDTSWLIPQDYRIQIRLKSGSYCRDKESISFSVVSNTIIPT